MSRGERERAREAGGAFRARAVRGAHGGPGAQDRRGAHGGRGAHDGGGAQGRRGGRAGRAAAAAVSGLAVAATVLVPAALSPAAAAGAAGAGGDTAQAVRPARAARAHRPAAGPQAQPQPKPAPKPEKCSDGRNPAASLRPSGSAGPAVRRIQHRGRLIVGVDGNSYLWGYRDPAGSSIDGFDIDLVHAIARDLLGDDPDVTYKTIPTDQRIAAIQDGDVDMVVRTMTINCRRLADVAFSTAYFEAGQQLVVPRHHALVTGFDGSLRGRRLCFAAGSTAQTLMRGDPYRRLGAEPVVVANQLDCLVRMELGEADATLTDSALGAGQAAQDPDVGLIGEPVTDEPYGVAMNRSDEDLVRRVNKVLADYRKGGAHSPWRTSYDKWLADDIEGTHGKKAPAPPKPAYRD